ncbi:MAG: hypothetical protein ABIJ74_04160 [archaeon]
MTLNVVLPLLNGNKVSSKDAIISLLVYDYPLTAKKIHLRLKRENGLNVSYQAVHKVLRELEKEKMINRNENSYSLSVEWIKKIKNFADTLEKCYLSKDSFLLKKVFEQDSYSITLNSSMNFAAFILDVFFDYTNPEKKPSICHWWSMYPTFSLSDEQYKRLKEKIENNQYYMLAHNETTLDKSFAENFEKMGAKVKLGVNVPFNPDTIVQGDYVGLIYFEPKFRKDILNYYKLGGLLEKVKINKLLSRLYESKVSINVVVIKNPEIADKIRKQTITHFKGENKK